MATDLYPGERVRVRDDAPNTRYQGRTGVITQAFLDMEGRPRYMVAFDDGSGKGSVYHANELELLEEGAKS
jgi:hypothetical protein